MSFQRLSSVWGCATRSPYREVLFIKQAWLFDRDIQNWAKPKLSFISPRGMAEFFAEIVSRHNKLSFWQMNFSSARVKVISWFSVQWNLHLAPKLQFILAVLWDFIAARVRSNVSRINNYFPMVPCLILTFTVCCNLNRNWFLESARIMWSSVIVIRGSDLH